MRLDFGSICHGADFRITFKKSDDVSIGTMRKCFIAVLKSSLAIQGHFRSISCELAIIEFDRMLFDLKTNQAVDFLECPYIPELSKFKGGPLFEDERLVLTCQIDPDHVLKRFCKQMSIHGFQGIIYCMI